ncbi:hypothetical protein AXF42_Ash013900 [Apostasia shenzhenica]|uniref:Exonuclease domain-containing protein n=1 Tax=Apostasia shenzhenica TaxID=1088818 RepID=A0A2I0AS61_9ASPA|nr:hypothetical protein AXF42_Ash013900 [Apostasia shenzhenica]
MGSFVKMSFATIWSGNYHQLRNCVGSNCSFKLLRSPGTFFSGKVVEPIMCYVQPLVTKAEGRNKKSHSSKACDIHLGGREQKMEILRNLHKMKSDVHEHESVEHYSIQKISEKWLDRPATVLVFDTETTGLSRERGRIIEIAIRDLLGGENSTFQTLINPGRAVPNTYIHGIRSDMVKRPGVPRFEELIPILLEFVSSRQKNGKPVLWIAHNGRRFDVPFLIREFNRCSVEIPEDWLFLDTLYLARQIRKPDGTKLTSFSLNALREHYRISLMGPAHRAMQDVNVLAYVVREMTFDLKLTIPELMQIAFRPSDVAKAG